MLLAKINNGLIEVIAEHTNLFPNTSFPESGPNGQFINENSCLPVSLGMKYDQKTQKITGCNPYILDGVVYTSKIESLTQEDFDKIKEEKANQARKIRNEKLKDTDWTQLPDYPKNNKAEWASYRKKLRDIPQQEKFPEEIVWPEEPIGE